MPPDANQAQTQPTMPLELDYARRSLRPRHSFYSCLALVMSGVTVAWMWYLSYCHPRYHQGGPFWEALFDNMLWPGGITMALAVIGLIQNSRKRKLSIVAIVVTVLAYLLLVPPMNFA